MLYLFNDSAVPNTTPKDIWLTGEGYPVFVTALSKDFGAIPQGSKLAGKIESSHPENYQLTKNGQLTEVGQIYCDIMGVEKTSASLTRFISSAGYKFVDVNGLVKTGLELA